MIPSYPLNRLIPDLPAPVAQLFVPGGSVDIMTNEKRFHLVSPQAVLWQLSSTPLSDECQATADVSGWGGSCMLCSLSCLPPPFNIDLEIVIKFQIRPKILKSIWSCAPWTKTVFQWENKLKWVEASSHLERSIQIISFGDMTKCRNLRIKRSQKKSKGSWMSDQKQLVRCGRSRFNHFCFSLRFSVTPDVHSEFFKENTHASAEVSVSASHNLMLIHPNIFCNQRDLVTKSASSGTMKGEKLLCQLCRFTYRHDGFHTIYPLY